MPSVAAGMIFLFTGVRCCKRKPAEMLAFSNNHFAYQQDFKGAKPGVIFFKTLCIKSQKTYYI